MVYDTSKTIRADVTKRVFQQYIKGCSEYGGMDGCPLPLCKSKDNSSFTTGERGLKRCNILACPDAQNVTKLVDKKLEEV